MTENENQIESTVTTENIQSGPDKWYIEGGLTREWIFSILAEGWDTWDLIKNYQLSEELILENHDLLDKNVIKGLNLTQNFILKALELEYFTTEDLKDLTMVTYSNLSDSFLKTWEDNINWERMILLLSTREVDFESWMDIIDSRNLWKTISANDLPIQFIRKYKDKLDWGLLSIVKEFTSDEKNEFNSYIVQFEREETQTKNKEFSIDDIANLMSDIY
jgi:hypothetical protein